VSGIELIIFFVISVLAVSAVMVSLALGVPVWVVFSVLAVLAIALSVFACFSKEADRIENINNHQHPSDPDERQALLSKIAARVKAEREAKENSDIF
jgi:membrane protein implicated in regulation of membrane protease activity